MEDVTPRAQTVDAECLPKQFFDTEWEVPKNLCIDNIQICDHRLSFSDRNKPVIDPTAKWGVVFRDGTELMDLESAVKQTLSNAQAMNYFGARETKMRIKFEANLGDFWLEVIDIATDKILSSYERVAETVTAQCSGLYSKMLEDYDEFFDLRIFVHAHITIRSVRVESGIQKFSTDMSMDAAYPRFFTFKKNEAEVILAAFLSRQNKDRISELSDNELALLLKDRNRKLLPSSIKGIRYIGDGQPRLVLDEYIMPFDGDTATKEANLAEILFGQPRDLAETVTYEEIFETLEGKNASDDEMAQFAGRKWLDLGKKERDAFIKDYKQRMRQLNYRLGAMLGLGAIKALVSVDAGIAIDHRLL